MLEVAKEEIFRWIVSLLKLLSGVNARGWKRVPSTCKSIRDDPVKTTGIQKNVQKAQLAP